MATDTAGNRNSKHWQSSRLLILADTWLQRLRVRKQSASEHSHWWDFVFRWRREKMSYCQDFIAGVYRFSPMQRFAFAGETITIWDYPDRLIISLLLSLIKPVFKHIISPQCLHLQGPSGVKTATQQLQKALKSKPFRYVIRADIRGYYASIDHEILIQQVQESFDDPRVRGYFQAMITAPIDAGGVLLSPNKGIPRRSGLSPFLGALYLTPLDRAFEQKKGVYYVRYMDDIIILAQTKRQYVKAKRRLYYVLNGLKLQLSPHKTRMGMLADGFHFLGVKFESSQNDLNQIQVTAEIHDRSCRRALERVRVMKEDAVNSANIQRYLLRWATWWARTIGLYVPADLLVAWQSYIHAYEPQWVWLARGLLI